MQSRYRVRVGRRRKKDAAQLKKLADEIRGSLIDYPAGWLASLRFQARTTRIPINASARYRTAKLKAPSKVEGLKSS